MQSKGNYKHGGQGTRLYQIWKSMRERCNTPTSSNYKRYGGKGIKICKEWDDFAVFREWAMSHGYADKLTIDRIDSNKDYCPDNCRWATYLEQAQHLSHTKIIEYDGERLSVAAWGRKLGIKPATIHWRLSKGWSVERALTTKVRAA